MWKSSKKFSLVSRQDLLSVSKQFLIQRPPKRLYLRLRGFHRKNIYSSLLWLFPQLFGKSSYFRNSLFRETQAALLPFLFKSVHFVTKVGGTKIVPSRSLPLDMHFCHIYCNLVVNMKVGLPRKLKLQRYVLTLLNAVFSE